MFVYDIIYIWLVRSTQCTRNTSFRGWRAATPTQSLSPGRSRSSGQVARWPGGEVARWPGTYYITLVHRSGSSDLRWLKSTIDFSCQLWYRWSYDQEKIWHVCIWTIGWQIKQSVDKNIDGLNSQDLLRILQATDRALLHVSFPMILVMRFAVCLCDRWLESSCHCRKQIHCQGCI